MSHGRSAVQPPSAPHGSAGDDLRRSSRSGWRGRTREWKLVAGLLRAAQRGRGGVLLVEGESGMGKSRLLEEAVEAAGERGFLVARGVADESASLTPLKPLMAALGESTHALLASRRDTTPFDARLWLVEELQARLEERSARAPLLVTLDDLQWADPTTLLALRSLVPELASYPLVWILSANVGSSEVYGLYEALERDGATRLTVEPLDEQAVAEVVADVLGAAPDLDLLALAASAGGNPFLLVELLGGLRDEGALEMADGRARLVSQRLPRRVQEIARSRLAGLSANTRHLLQVAAVLGRSFDARDLADLLGESPAQLLPALEEAAATGVVVPAGDRLAFRHDLLWRAVSETLTVSVRQALHQQAGEMLLSRGGSAIPAAAHLMRSARRGDTAALAGMDRAAREVMPSSPQTAADLVTRALELTEPSDPGRFCRTVAAVDALTASGRLTEAAELTRAALARTTSSGQIAHLRYELGYALLVSGRPAAAMGEVEEALSRRDLPAEVRDLAEGVLFAGAFAIHDYHRGRERARTIVAAPDRYAPPALVGAHTMLAGGDWAEGRAAEAIGHLRHAVRLSAGGPIQARHAHPGLILANALMGMRRLTEAETVLQAADQDITAIGHTAFAAAPAIFRARLRLIEGRGDDAAAEASAGLASAEELGMHAYDMLGIAVLAIVAARRGDFETAIKHVEHYLSERAAVGGDMYGGVWCAWGVALVVEAQRGPAAAIELFSVPYTDPTKLGWLLMTEPAAAPWLTRTALAVADRARAESIAAVAGRFADANPGFPTLSASAAHARGLLDRDPAALAHAAATHVGPWDRASAVEDLGVLHAHAGTDPEAAVEYLDQALDGYQCCCALRDAARVRARLRGLGVRRRHWSQAERPVSGWQSLTETERKIAELVAQGLTNRQVAAQVYISPHTVKFHLRQVFRKLDIGSRVELARLATEHASDT